MLPHVEVLVSTRRQYAESIRDLLWRRHRLRLSDQLLFAFARVPRENFLGPPPWLIRGVPATTAWQRLMSRIALHQHQSRDWTTRDPNQLYRDVVVAIDPSRRLNNGQPSGVATWLHLLELRSGDRVLQVGCGLGYYTAIIAAAVTPGEPEPSEEPFGPLYGTDHEARHAAQQWIRPGDAPAQQPS